MVLALRFKKNKSLKFNNALRCQSRLVSVIQAINITRCFGMEESKTFVAIPKIQSSTHRCVVSVRTLSTKSKPHAPIGYSSLTIHRGIPGRFCSCCEVRLDFCQNLIRTELLWVMISPEMVELLLVQPGSYISITALLPGKVQVNFDTETFLEVWFGTHWLRFFHCLTVWFLNNSLWRRNVYLSLNHAHTIIYCYYSWELNQKDLWLRIRTFHFF